MGGMNNKLFGLGLVMGLSVFYSFQLLAFVTVTSPSAGQGISADTAFNSTNGAGFTALGDIVITEGLTTDFAPGTNKTLILTLPDGWRFDTAAGASVSFQTRGDTTAASVAVTTSDVTVTLTVSGTTKFDTLAISGLEVQPLDGGSVDNLNGLYIYNLSVNPGTETIAGIYVDFTTFALLYTTPGTPKALGIVTQPSPTATAGVLFNPQPEVDTYDQFGNWCSDDYSTVIQASLGSGTGALQGGTTQSVLGGDVTYTNLSFNVANTNTILFTASGLTSVTSGPIVLGPGRASRLVFTTQPGAAASGFVFGTQPVVNSQDQFGNNSTVGLPTHTNVTMTLSSGAGPLLGATDQDIGTSAGNGVATYTNLEIDVIGSKQLTASSPGLTNAVSSTFSVNSATDYIKLLVLAPGETFAPGTATGKTGTPTPQTAGTAFSVTINAVNASENLVTNVTDTVAITASDTNAILPVNTALVNGTKTLSVTLKSAGSATVTASDVTDNTKTPGASSPIPVNAGTAAKLTLRTQPSSTATAGVAFAQQPIILVADAFGNLVATNNGRVITAARGAGTGTLQGTLTAASVNGVATFTNLSYNVAETITVSFSATGLTSTTSSNVVVMSAAADRLAFTTQPGGVSRTGSPLTAQPVVKSRDPFGNLSTVGLPSSLLVTFALSSGSGSLLGTFSLDIGAAAGNGTAACTNLQCSDAGTNKQLPASAIGLSNALSALFSVGGVERASGGGAISADTVGATYTSLTGPTYYEAANGDAGTGTIILNPPTGFIFDTTNTPAPTVLITRLGGSGVKLKPSAL